MAKVFLEIDAKTAKAQKQLTKFGSTATKTMKGIQNSLTGVKVLAAGVAGFFAARGIASGINKITEAASVQEDAINSLNTALKTSGEFSEQASRDMQEFASQLQQTSVYGDELVLNQLALAKAFGATNEQAKQVVTAASELAAATGKSLDESTRQVSKTLGGFAGELGEVNPAIKALTAEQLKAGEAAKILIDQYGGSALSKISTFSGASTQLSNTFGDLQEELGFIITRNPVVIEGIKNLTDFFGRLIDIVKDNQEGLTTLISKSFKGLIAQAPKIVSFIAGWVEKFFALKAVTADVVSAFAGFIEASLELSSVINVVNKVSDAFKTLWGGILLGVSAVLKGINSIPGVSSVAESVIGDIDQAIADLEQSAVDITVGDDISNDIRQAAENVRQSAEQMRDDTVKSFEDIQPAIQSVQAEVQKLSDDIQSIPDKKIKVSAEVTQTTDEGGFFSMAKEFGTKVVSSMFETIKSANIGEVIAKGFGFALQGKSGATKAVAGLADAFLPGVGGIVEQLAALGPEGAKAMIKEFAESLPDIIVTVVEALAASADVIVESLIDSLLVKGGLERIVVALIQAIPRVAYKLVESTIRGLNNGIVAISERFGLNITRNMEVPEWVEKLRRYIRGLTITPEWMRKFQFEQPNWMKRLEEMFNWLPNAIRKAIGLSSGGGTSGTVKGALNPLSGIVGGSKGGVIPLYARSGALVPRGTDTVPAMLTPGERVLTVQQNESFEALPAILAQLLQVMSQPIEANTTIELDGNTLADVILQLSRQNARLTA